MSANEQVGETPCGEVPPEELQKKEVKKQFDDVEKDLGKTNLKDMCKMQTEFVSGYVSKGLFVLKFKQYLHAGPRKHKAKTENYLVAFSGGPSSRAMLHVMGEIAREKNTPSFRGMNVHVVFIDESATLQLSSAESETIRNSVIEIAKSYNFEIDCIPLEDIFKLNNLYQKVEDNSDNTSKLKKLIDETSSNTSKEDLINTFKNSLIIQHAVHLGIKKVLLGNNATRLATQLISNTCKGRGFTVPEDIGASVVNGLGTGPQFQKYEALNISVVFPMKDALSKEVAIYNRYKNISPVFIPTVATKSIPKFSIDTLTENFIEGLQREFGHTVHTLLKSGGKLCLPTEPKSDESASIDPDELAKKCPLCFGYVGYFMCLIHRMLTPEEAELAKRLFKSNSNDCSDGSCSNNGCSNENECGSNECCSSKSQVVPDLKNLVCYACQRILRETKQEDLPSYVKKQSIQAVTRQNMRDQIKDFLLE